MYSFARRPPAIDKKSTPRPESDRRQQSERPGFKPLPLINNVRLSAGAFPLGALLRGAIDGECAVVLPPESCVGLKCHPNAAKSQSFPKHTHTRRVLLTFPWPAASRRRKVEQAAACATHTAIRFPRPAGPTIYYRALWRRRRLNYSGGRHRRDMESSPLRRVSLSLGESLASCRVRDCRLPSWQSACPDADVAPPGRGWRENLAERISLFFFTALQCILCVLS